MPTTTMQPIDLHRDSGRDSFSVKQTSLGGHVPTFMRCLLWGGGGKRRARVNLWTSSKLFCCQLSKRKPEFSMVIINFVLFNLSAFRKHVSLSSVHLVVTWCVLHKFLVLEISTRRFRLVNFRLRLRLRTFCFSVSKDLQWCVGVYSLQVQPLHVFCTKLLCPWDLFILELSYFAFVSAVSQSCCGSALCGLGSYLRRFCTCFVNSLHATVNPDPSNNHKKQLPPNFASGA